MRLAAQYQHLTGAHRSAIRKAWNKHHPSTRTPGVWAYFLRSTARKYGVKADTVSRVVSDGPKAGAR